MKRALTETSTLFLILFGMLALGCGGAEDELSLDAKGLSLGATDEGLPMDALADPTPSRPARSVLDSNLPVLAASTGSETAIAATSVPHSFLAPQSWGTELGEQWGWNLTRHLRTLAHVNYDSKADLIGFGDDGVWVALSTGTKFGSARFVIQDFGYNQGWRLDRHLRVLEDLNNDGLEDIVAFGDDGVWTALSANGYFAPHRFVLAAFGWNQGYRLDQHARLLADVNGDGQKDIVAFHDTGVSIALGDALGGFQAATPASAEFGSNQGWTAAQHERVLADIDGDGRADIVAFGYEGVYTALSIGTAFAPARHVLADFGTAHGWTATTRRLLADIDRDGIAEIVGFGHAGVYVARSTSDGWFAPATLAARGFVASNGRVADLNADGYADLLGLRLGSDAGFPQVIRALGGPSGFSSAEVALHSFIKGEPFALGDVDGDGKRDLMKLDFRDPVLSGSFVNYVARSSSAPIPPSPVAPRDLRVTSVTSSSVSLAWSYPAGTDMRYFVLSGPSTRVFGLAQASVGGLQPGTEYCFKVQAQTWFSRSPATAPVCARTAASGSGTGGMAPTQTVCGVTLSCPNGYHPARYIRSDCPGSGVNPNATFCALNSGNFEACGVSNCPSGWHAVRFYFAPSCIALEPGPLLPNASACAPNTREFDACTACPSGYTTTSSTSTAQCDHYPWVHCVR